MKYVIYVRVSGIKQKESGLGLEAQRKACNQWINHQDEQGSIEEWTEVGTGTDKEEDALEKREILMSAIESLLPGDIFIVYSRCRLARSPYLMAMIERLIERKKCKLISVTTNNEDTPEGALLRMMVDAFAKYEALIISRRTKKALGEKKARGERVGYVPFGKRVGMGDKLVYDAGEVRTLKRMKELRKMGSSLRTTAEVLNLEGHTNRGKPWNHVAVKRLSNHPIP